MTINELRAKTGLSQSMFADRYNIPLPTLQAWERGKFSASEYGLKWLQRLIELEETGVLFRDEQHKKDFYRFLKKMKRQDSYHLAVAYLLALDEVIVEHVKDVFDFEAGSIKFDTVLQHGWQTGTSQRTTRLMMNLWNGYCYTPGEEDLNVSSAFTVDNIFDCEYTLYYCEAVKLRYMKKNVSVKGEMDFTKRRFGRLVAVRPSEEESAKSGKTMWECDCDCGNTTVVSVEYLLESGRNKSCGCLQKATPKMIIRQWQKENPAGIRAECVRATGFSRVTVSKWWCEDPDELDSE